MPRDPAPIAFAFFLCEFWMKTQKLTTWTEIVFLRPILQTLGWEIILGWLDILEIAFNIEKGITILLRLFAHYLKHFEGSLNIDMKLTCGAEPIHQQGGRPWKNILD